MTRTLFAPSPFFCPKSSCPTPTLRLFVTHPDKHKFKLTIGVRKTTNLAQPFLDFPMTGAGTTTAIHAAGKLEFQFPVSDNAAFFRLQSQ